MLTQVYIHFFVALAGLASFLSPCVLPLVPPYLTYLGGTTLDQLAGQEEIDSALWRKVLLASVLFVLGFTTVFVGFGAGASVLGQWIQTHKSELAVVAGIVIILFGLHFLGLLLVYSLGLGIPFILAAVAIGPFLGFLKRFRRHLGRVEKAMGLLLVAAGILILTGSLNALGTWLLDNVPALGQLEEQLTPKGLQTEILKEGAR
jgi:cytochrome c-type biogenesis protein